MSRANIIKVNFSLQEFICPVSLDIPTQPVLASCCGITFDLESVKNLTSCPCCRSKEAIYSAASSAINDLLQCIRSTLSAQEQDTGRLFSVDLSLDFIGSLITSDDQSRVVRNTIDAILAQHLNLYEHIPFNLDFFVQIVRKNKLSTSVGKYSIAQLKNNTRDLNRAGVIGTLASTANGRLILRKNLNVKVLDNERVLFFGNATLFYESLTVKIDGEYIVNLLARDISVSLDVDLRTQFPRWLLQEEIQKTKFALEAKAQHEFRILLSVARKRGLFHCTVTAEYQYPSHPWVNKLLQKVVYGQRTEVQTMLDWMKHRNSTLLKVILTSNATTPVIDYSGKKIENMTALQAAIAAGDVAIQPDLAKNDADHQGMCEIIRSYLNEDDQSEIAEQYASLLKRSLCENYPREQISSELNTNLQDLWDLHDRTQKQNTFDFSKIIAAIIAAEERAKISGARDEISAVLSLYREEGASFTESDAARTKDDDQLNLTESLNRFREQFEKHALTRIVVNPYDLLKAFQIYHAHSHLWTLNQCNLFARQVIGFVQRYLSAADARVFAYGLHSALDNREKIPNHFNFRDDPDYHIFPLSGDRSCFGLGFDYMAAAGTGAGKRGKLDQAGSHFLENLYRAKGVAHQALACRTKAPYRHS